MEKAATSLSLGWRKITLPEPSSWRCTKHDCEIPNEPLMIGSHTFTVSGSCPSWKKDPLEAEERKQEIERRKVKMLLRGQAKLSWDPLW